MWVARAAAECGGAETVNSQATGASEASSTAAAASARKVSTATWTKPTRRPSSHADIQLKGRVSVAVSTSTSGSLTAA